MKIAILGATSHIAKGLTFHFLDDERFELSLFARNTDAAKDFLASIGRGGFDSVYHIDSFGGERFDAVINCVGVGTPKSGFSIGGNILFITERFDNLIIDYISRTQDARYINFSSGAVFGKSFRTPVDASYRNCVDVNAISKADFYSIAKLNSETKHRMCAELPIIDLRVFSYFSRFVDMDAGYLVTDMMKCAKEKREFVTNGEDIVRDYTVPSELFSLVVKCLLSPPLNTAIDVRSTRPVRKFELVDYFRKSKGLTFRVEGGFAVANASGDKANYYSVNENAQCVGFEPSLSSLEGIDFEIRKIGGF